MHDPLRVRGFERLGDLPRDRQRLFDRNRPLREASARVGPLDQLQHKGLARPRFLKAVNRADFGMIQRGEDLRFALEAGKPVGIVRDSSGRTFIATSRLSVASRAR